MTSTPPFGPNYKPVFHMPLIGPAPSGTVPETFYALTYSDTTIQATPAAHDTLTIGISNPANSRLFAMCSGNLFFFPPGDPHIATLLSRYPGLPAPVAGAGVLTLQVWTDDIDTLRKVLPPRVPPMLEIIYLNVDPSSVREALTPVVQDQNANPDYWLESLLDDPSVPTPRKQLEDNYLDLILKGRAGTLVRGATPIGDASQDSARPATTGAKLTLFFLDRGGNGTSPIPHLRGLPSYSNPQWAGHPLLLALTGVPTPANFYLQFEVWNETPRVLAFEPLRSGVAIDLVSTRGTLDTQRTDAKGQVAFRIPDLKAVAGETPKIFFVARTKGVSQAGLAVPDDWSTAGWMAKDGTAPASFEKFTGSQLGDAASPLVICIGLDLHIKLEYVDESNSASATVMAPPGVPVGIHSSSIMEFTDPPKRTIPTNSKGEVHGVVFDVKAEEHIFFHVDFEVQDLAIGLQKARVRTLGKSRWDSFEADADHTVYANNVLTSRGTQTNPHSLKCSLENRNTALYIFKIVREWSSFLFYVTGGTWTGVPNLQIDLFYFPDLSDISRKLPNPRSFSWPLNQVNLKLDDGWERNTIAHELSHQIMWKESQIKSLDIAALFITGIYHHDHSYNMMTDRLSALFEGWAAFIEAIFISPTSSARGDIVGSTGTWDLSTVYNANWQPLNNWNNPTLNPNMGESIEGAFANGLLALFWKYVAGSFTTHRFIHESENGDIAVRDPWIKANAQAMATAFSKLLLIPLRDLSFDVSITPAAANTRAMLQYIRSRNLSDWHKLLADLQALNMFIENPVVNNIFPNSGPSAGGSNVRITGQNFSMNTTVTVDSIPVNNLVIASSTSLTFDTPVGRHTGSVDLIVTTLAGFATSSFNYL